MISFFIKYPRFRKLHTNRSGLLKFPPVVLALMVLQILSFSSCRKSPDDTKSPNEATGLITEEVRIQSGENLLAGTLYRPAGVSNSPALVLLAGGDRSRRGDLRMRLARNFAINGIAALIYDSPGTGSSTGNALMQNRTDRVREALNLVDWLRRLTGIRPDAVGLFGGSEGADIALMAGAADPNVAFVIPVSGSLGVSVLDVLRYSAEKRGYNTGLNTEEMLQAITFKEIAFVLLAGVDILEWPLIETRIGQWEDVYWKNLLQITKDRLKNPAWHEQQAIFESFLRVIDHFSLMPWFKVVDVSNSFQFLEKLNAEQFWQLLESGRYSRDWTREMCFSNSDLRCPVLAIWGIEDDFLPPYQSAATLRQYLSESQHPDFELVMFPDASHYITKPGMLSEFVPGYLDSLTTWLDRHFHIKPSD